MDNLGSHEAALSEHHSIAPAELHTEATTKMTPTHHQARARLTTTLARIGLVTIRNGISTAKEAAARDRAAREAKAKALREQRLAAASQAAGSHENCGSRSGAC